MRRLFHVGHGQVPSREALLQSCCNCVDSTREPLAVTTDYCREEITHTLTAQEPLNYPAEAFFAYTWLPTRTFFSQSICFVKMLSLFMHHAIYNFRFSCFSAEHKRRYFEKCAVLCSYNGQWGPLVVVWLSTIFKISSSLFMFKMT